MKVSEFKQKLKEDILSTLSEKKKKKDEEVPEEEVTDTETTDIELPDNVEGESTGENGVDPKTSAIQISLKAAYDGAKELGDEKLTTQIGNTITYFTRAHVVKGEPGVAESLKSIVKEVVRKNLNKSK